MAFETDVCGTDLVGYRFILPFKTYALKTGATTLGPPPSMTASLTLNGADVGADDNHVYPFPNEMIQVWNGSPLDASVSTAGVNGWTKATIGGCDVWCLLTAILPANLDTSGVAPLKSLDGNTFYSIRMKLTGETSPIQTYNFQFDAGLDYSLEEETVNGVTYLPVDVVDIA